MNSKCFALASACAILTFASSVTSSVVAEATDTTPSVMADARQQVMKLEKQWAAAEDKHDEATLRRILDDKFVATFGANKPYDKETFIREEISGVVDPTASQTLDETVILDGDTAIVIGTDTERGTRNGATYTAFDRYTVTYVSRNGQWRALAEHIAR
jgi:hypothetical protein